MDQHLSNSAPLWPHLRTLLLQLSCITIAFVLSSRVARSTDIEAPLADAIEQQNTTKIRELLAKDVDPNAAQVDGMTALHWAVYYDNLSTTKQLVAIKADVNAQNRYGVPPLSLACKNGSLPIVKLLLDAGADPNARLHGGESVLMTAARTGMVGPVRVLIEAGAEVNGSDDSNQTAIMWAAAEGHGEVVQALIDAKADFRASLESGFTPLFFAVREGQSEVITKLLAAGADVNEELRPQNGSRNRRTNALILAVENGHFETAAYLLEAGADPNAAPAGFTALHAINRVRRPLRGDTDPPPVGSGDMNSLNFVRRLIKSGADIDHRYGRTSGKSNRYSGGKAQFGKSGATALLMAARNSDLQLLRLLLDSGANWKIENGDNCSALLIAAGVGALGSGDELPGTEEQVIATVRLFLKLGANINAVADHGETAMHGAAYHERPALVQFLIDNGADISIWNRQNKFGWTPLMIARGHRPGNFRPSPKTIAAIENVMRAKGVEPPPDQPRTKDDKRYR
ncbi:MAG: ankyrin repeat domain-containing protein [Pirellulaceae bacterium]|nr:ankyrin repeat domain-containing protein [Pirellulaceae bacterium]